MPLSIIEGKVWKFGDNISTDLLMPKFARGETPMERALFCMRANRPEFSQKVQTGDVIVAGRNFGCGSSRPAARNLVTLGISSVIAESFGRLFFRSSVSLGFPLLSCKGVCDVFKEGDTIQVDFHTREVRNLTSGRVLLADCLPEIVLTILNAGGIVELLKKEYRKE